MIIYLPYGNTANPDGFPSDFPSEIKEWPDKDPIPDGWVQTTKEAVEAKYRDNAAAAADIISRREADDKTAAETRHTQFVTSLRRLDNLNEKLISGTHSSAERLEAEIINHRVTLRMANWALEQLRNS